MCATTQVHCRECDEPLYLTTGRRAVCSNGHTAAFADMETPGRAVTSQYHGSGRSMAMLRTLCVRCRPI